MIKSKDVNIKNNSYIQDLSFALGKLGVCLGHVILRGPKIAMNNINDIHQR